MDMGEYIDADTFRSFPIVGDGCSHDIVLKENNCVLTVIFILLRLVLHKHRLLPRMSLLLMLLLFSFHTSKRPHTISSLLPFFIPVHPRPPFIPQTTKKKGGKSGKQVTGYMLFVKENRGKVKADNPEITFGQIVSRHA
jgi:hypothetical protein